MSMRLGSGRQGLTLTLTLTLSPPNPNLNPNPNPDRVSAEGMATLGVGGMGDGGCVVGGWLHVLQEEDTESDATANVHVSMLIAMCAIGGICKVHTHVCMTMI